MSFYIESYKFAHPVRNESGKLLSDDVMGTNWPVVYLIHGNKELYIGETSDANGRMEQHLDPKGKHAAERGRLNKVDIIFDTTFNKSAILDIEQSLIRLFKFEINSKDESKKSRCFKSLQNGNNGQSRQHNYYRRAHYQQEIEQIWNALFKSGLATNQYKDIVNDSIFKFSPYSTLTSEQGTVCLDILERAIDSLFAQKEGKPNEEFTAIVQGSAGTGKTIILLHMMARLAEISNSVKSKKKDDTETLFDDEDEEDYAIALERLNRANVLADRIRLYVQKYGRLRIGYVAQMTSLRETIATALNEIPYLKKGDALGPNKVVNHVCDPDKGKLEKYDILFIDEAHRLWQRKSIQNMGSFDAACRKLYGKDSNPSEKTALDWLMDCSKTRVIIYDELQSVKDSDITREQYDKAIYSRSIGNIGEYKLKQQMRCSGGVGYISYLNDLFDCVDDLKPRPVEEYDLKLVEDPNKLIDNIILKNEQFGLCRTATGYGWQWKKKKYDLCNKQFNKDVAAGTVNSSRGSQVNYYVTHLSPQDGLIEFGDRRYVRNLDFNWIIDGDAREIGCIHTSQGYDLNYVGVLFGPEIDYVEGQGIVVYEKKIKDKSVNTTLKGLTGDRLIEKKSKIKEFVLNAYKVMMERGIKGCYVWAYNPGLQEYLSRFIEKL